MADDAHSTGDAPAAATPPRADDTPATETHTPATETHTPVLELPAAPRELRPSPLAAPSPELDHAALATPLPPRPTAMSEATAEALAHLRREGAWRTVFRVLGVVATLALCLRLAFDDALPRLVLGVGGALLGALVIARALHAWSLARRRRALLDALDLLTRMGNAHPESLKLFAPQIASLVDALREQDRRAVEFAPDEVILRALRSGGGDAAAPRAD